MLQQIQAELEENPLVAKYVITIGIIVILLFISPNQLSILKNEFSFYKKLSPKHKRYFEHRVVSFIADKNFIGRENLKVTDQMKVLIAATAVMVTFGFRKYKIKVLEQIIIYPEAYYSSLSEAYHKGEFNPRMNALAMSWIDFKEGYKIEDDNLNLGIHEIVHAIHFNSLQKDHISAILFKNTYLDLTDFLQKKPKVRAKIIETKYFREYAFTDQFEFLSVLIEILLKT